MLYISVLLGVVLVDQLTKAWIVDFLLLYESKEIIPSFFNLVYVTNKGAAFSIMANIDSPWRHYFFLIVGSIALVGLTIASWNLGKTTKFYYIPLGLIAGGAVGNLIDRLRLGSVIDFLDFYLGQYHWPAFNVADSAICLGLILLILNNIKQTKNNRR